MNNSNSNISVSLKILGEQALTSLVSKMEKAQSLGSSFIGGAQRWTPESVSAYGYTTTVSGRVQGNGGRFQGQMGGSIPGSSQSGLSGFMQNPLIQLGKTAGAAMGAMNGGGLAAGAVWGSYESIQQRAELERATKAFGDSADAADKLHASLLDTAKQFGVTASAITQFATSAMGGGLSPAAAQMQGRWAAGLNASGIRPFAVAGQDAAQRGIYGSQGGASEAMVDAVVALVMQNPGLGNRGEEIYKAISGMTEAVQNSSGASAGNYDKTFLQYAGMMNALGATGAPGLQGQLGANALGGFGASGGGGLGLAYTMAGFSAAGGKLDYATMQDMKNDPSKPEYMLDRMHAMFPNGTTGLSPEEIQNKMAIVEGKNFQKDTSVQFAQTLSGMSASGMDALTTQLSSMGLDNINPGALNYAAAAATLKTGGKTQMGDANSVLQQYLVSTGMSQGDAQAWIKKNDPNGATPDSIFQAIKQFPGNSGLGNGTGQQQEADLTKVTTAFVQSGKDLSSAVDGVANAMYAEIDAINKVIATIPHSALKTGGEVVGGGTILSSALNVAKGGANILQSVGGGALGILGIKSLFGGLKGGSTVAGGYDVIDGVTAGGAATEGAGTAAALGGGALATLGSAAIPVVGAGLLGADFANTDAGKKTAATLNAHDPGSWLQQHDPTGFVNWLSNDGSGKASKPSSQRVNGAAHMPGDDNPYADLSGHPASGMSPNLAANPKTFDGSNKELLSATGQAPAGAQGSLAYGTSTLNTQKITAQSLALNDPTALAQAFADSPLTAKLDTATQHGLALEIAKAMKQVGGAGGSGGIGGVVGDAVNAISGSAGPNLPATPISTAAGKAMQAKLKGSYDVASNGVLTPAQIAEGLIAHGFSGSQADLQKFVATSLEESAGGQVSVPNAGGSGARGLFQFMPSTYKGLGYNPSDLSAGTPGAVDNQFAAAVALYNQEHTKFSDWEGYTTGAYKGYMGTASAGVSGAYAAGGLDSNGNPLTTVPAAPNLNPAASAGSQTSKSAMNRAAGMNVNVNVSGKVAIDLGNGKTASATLTQDTPAQAYADAPVNATLGNF
jgi:hypothetical protein